jgi:two-component system response regulator HydG
VTQQVWEHIRRVAPYFRTALLTGESGTGALAAAKALHNLSPSSRRPLFVLDSAEAERRLTGGMSWVAPGESMLYLPEVSKLSQAAQSGLMRALRMRGPLAIRVVAYAVRGLRPLISAGTFSNDLAAALGAVHIALPAIRERSEDIPLLAQYLLCQHAIAAGVEAPILGDDFLNTATKFEWPGNLDQMSLAMRWLMKHNSGTSLHTTDLEVALEAIAETLPREGTKTRMVRLDTIVQEHIRAVLYACNGNKLRASEVLGISRSTLYRMLESPQSCNPMAIAG